MDGRRLLVRPWDFEVTLASLPAGTCRVGLCGTAVRTVDDRGPVCLPCRVLAPEGRLSYRSVEMSDPAYFRALARRPAGGHPSLREWSALEEVCGAAEARRRLARWYRLPLWDPPGGRPEAVDEAVRSVWDRTRAQASGIVPVGFRRLPQGGSLAAVFLRSPRPEDWEDLVRAAAELGASVVEFAVLAPTADPDFVVPAVYGTEVVAVEAVRALRPEGLGAAEILTAADKERLLREFRAGREGLRLLLLMAAEAGASDIHIEVTGSATLVRFRVSGQMRVAARLGPDDWELLAGAVRSTADMEAGRAVQERRGAFTVQFEDRRVDVRVSIVPVVVPGRRTPAEKVVLRLLDQTVLGRPLEEIGLAGPAWHFFDTALRAAVPKHPGLIVLSGATGSGKTTTLHALLRQLPLAEINVVAIEDPVEIFTPGVSQCAVSPAFGVVDAIRAFLRQDPDVILVGEVRDPETARAVYEAALTGHTVLTTLHADAAPDVFLRLAELVGENRVERMAAVVRLVSHQQLRRRPCPACAQTAVVRSVVGRVGTGCDRCRGGYSGVIPVYEVLALDGAILEAARRREGLPFGEALRREAAEAGTYVSLLDDARWKATRGWLDLRELEALAGPEWSLA